MTQTSLQNLFGTTPESFKQHVAHALQQTAAQPVRRRVTARTALLVAALLVVLTAAACAAFYSQVTAFFGQQYGKKMQAWLEKGSVATANQAFVFQGVTFTLDEVVYRDNGLYGLGTIRPQAGCTTVILPEDHRPDEPYGYDIYGESGKPEVAPASAPTVADIARQKGGKLLVVRAIPDLIGVDGGTLLAAGSVGFTHTPLRDGSIRFSFEVTDAYAVEEGEVYTIQMLASVCEMTLDGTLLEDTWQSKPWTVTIKPTPINAAQ